MGRNYINEDAVIFPTSTCVHDSNIGYEADFTVNGEVDGWTYFDGIHTYGAWGGFLFGTLYTDAGVIGRANVFRPIDADTHYTMKIVMKYNPTTREGTHALPNQGKVQWRTLADTNWDSRKEKEFTLYSDNYWHTYIINMGPEKYWIGDVNDLRVWPAIEDGQDGDEFFIRSIEITSVESHACLNASCDKFSSYEHPCPWTGQRGFCESNDHPDDSFFDIEEGAELIININDYGNEIIRVDEVLAGAGSQTANILSKNISATDIGGYAEVQVVYTDDNTFKIYSGTRNIDSTVVVVDTALARYLGFFDSLGNDISTKEIGELPASGYSPLSSFKIKTHSLLSLFDDNEDSHLQFDPFRYSIEGGRVDWLESSMGIVEVSASTNAGEEGGQAVRKYYSIDNVGKTIIDFNHPFNASGRIKHIYLACTLDNNVGKYKNEEGRKEVELSDAKILIFRPNRDGRLDVVYEFDLDDRDPDRGIGDELYALTQETVHIDVDVHINKGDYLGVYNANPFIGKSLTGIEIDAQYFQLDGELIGNFNPGRLYGEGSAGLLFYARGDDHQRRLVIDIDLKNRYNIENIEVTGEPQSIVLEYNIARCLDIEWEVELYGLAHWTSHRKNTAPGEFRYQRYNVPYGIDRLSDGVYDVPDGKACDSFALTGNNSSLNINYNAGPGVVPTNPYYFWINGDQEWLAVWLHALTSHREQKVYDFKYDPISIYIHFPFEKEKQIYKSKIYFKEKNNFRNIELSTYGGNYYTLGNSNGDVHYDLIPEETYTAITIDNIRIEQDSDAYTSVDEYLFKNPAIGREDFEQVGQTVYEWDPDYSQLIQDYGTPGDSGLFEYRQLVISNIDAMEQARKTDWNNIVHEWEPITCKGWRIFTDYHKSTKITEMELYGVADDIGSAFAGGISSIYSDYSVIWWATDSTEPEPGLCEMFVGDTPRYITIELLPVTDVRYDDIKINIQIEDAYVGAKGCEYVHYLDHAKLGGENQPNVVKLKNVYGNPYDLYVDIAPDPRVDDGVIYYSTLENDEVVQNPPIGPDGTYYKLLDYLILNDDYNCAINCDVYGLKNLIGGAEAYYSYDKDVSWSYYGELSHGQDLTFVNLPEGARSVINVPRYSRNRYWKLGFACGSATITVREMQLLKDGEILDAVLYHDLDLDPYTGPMTDIAHHLDNRSVTGSYYVIEGNDLIGADLGAPESIDQIILYHDDLEEYDNDNCNIDIGNNIYIVGSETNSLDDILDYSYKENVVQVAGTVFGDSTEPLFYKNSLYFPGTTTDYLVLDYIYEFGQRNWYFSFDAMVKFDEMPASGTKATFFGKTNGVTEYGVSYNYNAHDEGYKLYQTFENGNSIFRGDALTLVTGTWYHMAWARGGYEAGNTSDNAIFLDNVALLNNYYAGTLMPENEFPVRIGYNFKGWLTNIRLNSAAESYGSAARRSAGTPDFPVPTSTDERRFKMSLYVSDDGIHFGKYEDIDLWTDTDYYYHDPASIFSENYDTHFAIDLGKRRALDIIRSYGTTDKLEFNDVDYMAYSADDTDNVADVEFTDDKTDARWLRISLKNGDGVDRILRKIGVYPDIIENVAPPGDSYNCEWEDLGPSITAYNSLTNLALDATVSGSSSIAATVPGNVTDGLVSLGGLLDDPISNAWLSDGEAEQWLVVDLGEEKEVWRVKLHHGYDGVSTDFINVDYQVQAATTSGAFTTIHDITGNDVLEREHDLAVPVTARYIRLYITGYTDNWTMVRNIETGAYERFEGACLREIEVYEYYGYEVISSEDYPVVAVNLKDQFYIGEHELVGLFAEDDTYDWDNDDSNFAYSDSVLSDPQKVDFTAFGTAPNYEQWVVVKRDTASNHNADPAAAGADTGVDYLKHMLVQADQVKPNPCEYPWWWSSNISTLSRDFTVPVELCVSSLRVDYPASTALDNVQFIEGSDWGIDSDMAHRDGLSFRLYIEDVNKIDTSEGYVYFGGFDGTPQQNPIEYRWYLSTFSGTLATGWNRPFFRFKTADEVIYTEAGDDDPIDPRIIDIMTLKTAGIKFKGVGQPVTLNIDGFVIKRNRYEDQTRFQNGLYLAGTEYLSVPLGEIDFSAGAIEFWLRPDWDWDGMDIYNRYKNRSLFNFGSVANDIFGVSIIAGGITIYYGDVAKGPGVVQIQGLNIAAYDQLYHVGIVFSNTGRNISGDNSTIRVYLNNILLATHYGTWEIADNKSFKFTLGGKCPFPVIQSGFVFDTGSIDGVISDLRMYNYCKTDFTNSINGVYQTDRVDLLQPSRMIEISDDNVTYYSVGDRELPFLFEKVNPDVTIPIYVRSIAPEGLTGQERRTSGIVASWDVGV